MVASRMSTEQYDLMDMSGLKVSKYLKISVCHAWKTTLASNLLIQASPVESMRMYENSLYHYDSSE